MPSEPTGPPILVRLDDRFFRRFVRIILFFAAIYGLIALLPLLKGALFTLIVAVLITSVLDPVVSALERRGLNRIGAIVLIYILILVTAALLVTLASPIISGQITSLSRSLESESPAQLIDAIHQKLAAQFPLLGTSQISEIIRQKLHVLLTGFLEKSFSAAVTLLLSFPNLIIIAFCVFFFLKDGWRIKRAIIEMMPNRYFEIALIVVHKTTEQLGRYIRGQLIVAAAVGLMSIVALTLLHIRYSIFIGALAGLANMIPYFGPVAGAIPAIIIGLMDTGSMGVVLAVAGAFATVQLIENVFISPFVVSKSVELHPLAIIVVLLFGGALLGLWGLLLAVPAASIIKVVFSEIKWGVENYRLKERVLFEESMTAVP